ncbi:hypothetical protein GC089_10790 [Cellulomonas sp. JZ18]|uniref:hypothetical protein n=1 Tax=Cellulomonas sp. JZ18 TaxID=2654191 RepID=UPI0012D4B321|nr:hypothetical protein [Cellulomonas sp. JZ18]QGQ19623.1 hypothetical protein GC089_10790 [Cellulomonas sp. JZ18]
MLVAAALVPDTVLLLPGVAGGASHAPALAGLRDAALAAVAAAVDPAERVVVVAPGRADRAVAGRVRPGAAAAGVPDHLLTWPVPALDLEPAPGGPVAVPGPPGPAAAVGLQLVVRAGRGAGDGLHVVEVAARDVDALRRLGAALTGDGRTALVVVGSGSARHGPDAPLADDPRAPVLDDRLARALTDGGTGGRDVLAALDPALADALAVSGWGPWQVLVGALDAAGAAPRAVGGRADVVHGAAHAVACWQLGQEAR